MESSTAHRPSLNISFLNLPSPFHDNPQASSQSYNNSNQNPKPKPSKCANTYPSSFSPWWTLSLFSERKDSQAEDDDDEGLLSQERDTGEGEWKGLERRMKIRMALQI